MPATTLMVIALAFIFLGKKLGSSTSPYKAQNPSPPSDSASGK